MRPEHCHQERPRVLDISPSPQPGNSAWTRSDRLPAYTSHAHSYHLSQETVHEPVQTAFLHTHHTTTVISEQHIQAAKLVKDDNKSYLMRNQQLRPHTHYTTRQDEPREQTLFHGWWRSWDVPGNDQCVLQECTTKTSTRHHDTVWHHSTQHQPPYLLTPWHCLTPLYTTPATLLTYTITLWCLFAPPVAACRWFYCPLILSFTRIFYCWLYRVWYILVRHETAYTKDLVSLWNIVSARHILWRFYSHWIQ